MELLTQRVFAAARALSALTLAIDNRDQALADRASADLADALTAIDEAYPLVDPADREAARRLVDNLAAQLGAVRVTSPRENRPCRVETSAGSSRARRCAGSSRRSARNRRA
jgi:hypothetical protein